jgi:hypothetical protein
VKVGTPATAGMSEIVGMTACVDTTTKFKKRKLQRCQGQQGLEQKQERQQQDVVRQNNQGTQTAEGSPTTVNNSN